MKRILISVFVGLAIALSLSGCGRGKNADDRAGNREEKPGRVANAVSKAIVHAASGGKASFDAGDNRLRIKGDDGKEVRAAWDGTVPDEFPKDIPVYKGAQIVSSIASEQSFNLTLKTRDTVEAITGYYDKTLPADGWAPGESMNIEGNAMRTYKKDNRQVMVMVNDTKEDRMIILGASEERTEAN